MAEQPQSYNFGSRNGGAIIASLDLTGMITAGIGILLAILTMIAGLGLLPAIVVGIITAIVTFMPVLGRPVSAWVPVVAQYALARTRRPPCPVIAYDQTGASLAGLFEPEDRNVMDMDGAGFTLSTRGYVCVFAIEAERDFALASTSEQEEIVERWGEVLSALAVEGSAIKSLQMIERASAGVGDAATERFAQTTSAGSESREVYAELLADLGQQRLVHQTWLAVAIEPKGHREPSTAALDETYAVAQMLMRHQINARLLTSDEIMKVCDAIKQPFRGVLAEVAALSDHQLATPRPFISEGLDQIRIDSERHAVFEITEWPRINVSADWLYPLLASRPAGDQRVVSVHIDPVPPWKAVRRAEHAATNAASEMRRRSDMGFEGRSRDAAAFAAIANREDELAAGHAGVRIRGYVAVSAQGQTNLEQAVSSVRDAATRSRLQIRRLYGRQKDGLAACEPLCAPLASTVHETTTRHACTLWLPQVASPLNVPGVAIGRDVLSGATWSYDPFTFYHAGIFKSPNMLVMGMVGRGKSAFVKSYLWRQSQVFGRHVWVAGDPKGEYSSLAVACGLPIIHLEPGGKTRINPLDAGTETDETVIASRRVQLISALASTQLKRDLTPAERGALAVAVTGLGHEAALPELLDVLYAPTKAMAQALNTVPVTLAEETRELSLVLFRLVTGDLAGMFDGQSTVNVHNMRGGVIDLSGVYSRPELLAPIMACATHWITQQLIGHSGNQTILVLDEAWQALGSPGMADWTQATAKLSRSFGVQLLIIVHRLSDLGAVSADSDAMTKKVRGLLSDTDTIVSFAQQPGDLDATREALGLNDRETELLAHLAQGRCLFLAGQHHALVDVVLTEAETTITDTDQAL